MVLSFILSFSSVKRSMKRSNPMALAIATRYPYCKTLATPSLAHVQLIDSFPQLTVKHGYLEQSIYYFKITICWHHPFLVLLLLGPVLYHDLCLFHVRLHRCYNDHLHGLLLLLLCVNDQAMFEQRMKRTNMHCSSSFCFNNSPSTTASPSAAATTATIWNSSFIRRRSFLNGRFLQQGRRQS